MQLSVVIVNYNVRYFLEQCLLSVQKALNGIEAEVFVVDNHSVDGSVQLVKQKFPWVKLIANEDNPGFSKANNQAIRLATGKYILLLNPDTVVEETTFSKCIHFADAHADLGAMGVKMIDGKGKFLPESKRGLPTPWVSFYKIFGFSKLFPKSKTFGRYHLGFLSPDENHEVDVLSGAFLLLRKEALDKIGLLDEDYFMYGEDIDLSYRIIKGGYKNYYFSETKIIHYKGESTKKGSLNYVKVFYNAMIIFAKKHFSGGSQKGFIFFIHVAVYLRAFFAVAGRAWSKLWLPILESGLIYLSTWRIKEYWEYAHKYLKDDKPYPEAFDYLANPVYTLVFVSFLALAGAYKRPFRLRPIFTATIAGFLAIATMSYLFPSINFSRMIVGLASVAALFIGILLRGVVNLKESGNFLFTEELRKRVVIVADGDLSVQISNLIQNELHYPVEIVGIITVKEEESALPLNHLGNLKQLNEICRIFSIDEIVFANKSLSVEKIISSMSSLGDENIQYKIVPPDVNYLVGPQVIHESLRTQPVSFLLGKPGMQFKKRFLDVSMSLILLLTFPLHFWIYKRPIRALGNLFRVIIGKLHLVGYINDHPSGLPKLRSGVLNMLHRVKGADHASADHALRLDSQYAKEFSWELDMEILFKGLRKLGGA